MWFLLLYGGRALSCWNIPLHRLITLSICGILTQVYIITLRIWTLGNLRWIWISDRSCLLLRRCDGRTRVEMSVSSLPAYRKLTDLAVAASWCGQQYPTTAEQTKEITWDTNSSGVTATVRLRRWNTWIYWFWAGVVMRGLPYLSDLDPIQFDLISVKGVTLCSSVRWIVGPCGYMTRETIVHNTWVVNRRLALLLWNTAMPRLDPATRSVTWTSSLIY
jgi:hypothetical protein